MNKNATYNQLVEKSRTAREYVKKIQVVLKPYQLSPMQWAIIGMVYEAGKNGMNISTMAKRLGSSLAFVTTTVNILEARNFLNKSNFKEDGRQHIVRLKYEIEIEKVVEEIEDKLSAVLR